MWIAETVFVGAVLLVPTTSIPAGDELLVDMQDAVFAPPPPSISEMQACRIVGMVMDSRGNMRFDCTPISDPVRWKF